MCRFPCRLRICRSFAQELKVATKDFISGFPSEWEKEDLVHTNEEVVTESEASWIDNGPDVILPLL